MATTIRLAGAPDDSLPLTGMVLVEERSVYGLIQFYPANRLAEALTWLTGHKTLTRADLEAVKALGLTVMTTGAQPRQL